MFCYAENVPTTESYAFAYANIANTTLHVPSGSVGAYQAAEPWCDFKCIIALTDSDSNPEPKCATPTISIVNGELEFSCETEGVEYQWEITVADAQKGNSSKVSLTGVYKVSVYATKDGYEDSDVATTEFTFGGNVDTGVRGDMNGDNIVNALDIQTIIMIAAMF